MYQIFGIFISFCILTITALLCFIRPEMHKPFMVYDNSYIVEMSEPKPVDKTPKVVENTVVETINKTPDTVQKTTVDTKKEVKNAVLKNTVKTAPKTTTTLNTTPSSKTSVQTKTAVNTNTKNETSVSKKETPSLNKTQENKSSKQTIQQKPEMLQTKKEQPKITSTNTVNSEENITQEELILWNKWHSDIQNKIMREAKLPRMPEGTIMYFNFTVDRFGRITNIQTYSSNPQYTPYAIQFLAPLIRSYQGTSILNFPKNSQRFSTDFKGHFKISTKSKLSNPSDYSDTEKVIK